MALRLYRITDEQWQRLAAARRSQDLSATPPRAAIGAIEVELRSLDGARSAPSEIDAPRQAAAG